MESFNQLLEETANTPVPRPTLGATEGKEQGRRGQSETGTPVTGCGAVDLEIVHVERLRSTSEITRLRNIKLDRQESTRTVGTDRAASLLTVWQCSLQVFHPILACSQDRLAQQVERKQLDSFNPQSDRSKPARFL